MSIKEFFKRGSLRLLRYNQWLPDDIYLKILYRLKMGVKLNLKNPKTFQEKIQWLKLYNRKPEFSQMVDKLAVKDYVKKKIGEQYVIPTLGVWDKFEDIDFSQLPDKFVLKTTHGGGATGVVLCVDKNKFNYKEAAYKLNNSLKTDIYKELREWPYKNVSKRIIAEQFIDTEDGSDLTDYKIFCFNGYPKYIQVIKDRSVKETIDFFDINWKHQEFYGFTPKVKQSENKPSHPKYLEQMLEIAKILSHNITFLRVDLYHTEKGILFGELTFFPYSGLGFFKPDVWNEKIGELITLNNHIK